MPRFQVDHRTTYTYRRPVVLGEHRLMFRPRDSFDQRLLNDVLNIEPKPKSVRWIHDPFGNCITVIAFGAPTSVLEFDASIVLDHTPLEGPEFAIDADALHYPFSYAEDEVADLVPVIRRHYPDAEDEIGKWARRFLLEGHRTATGKVLLTLCYAIKESFSYLRRMEPGTQPPLFTLHQRRGTCRDFALFMMEAVRSLGLAARFVSGYIYVPSRDAHDRLGGGATHAWCQVYLPGAGWVEFDPTNGIVGNRDLIRVGVARDPSQAVPLWGTYEGLASDFLDMSVQVSVRTVT